MTTGAAAFDVREYARTADALRREELDLEQFAERPLGEDALRTIRYLHGMAAHTLRRMREVLVTPSHSDPAVTAFLSAWGYEEYWLADALAGVLEAHPALPAPSTPGTWRRGRTRARDRVAPVAGAVLTNAVGDAFVAVHVAWGATDEQFARLLYRRLPELDDHPGLATLARRVLGLKERHLWFYESQARARLAGPGAAARQRMTRLALERRWAPAGWARQDPADAAVALGALVDDAGARARVDVADRALGTLPGMAGSRPLARGLSRRGRL